MIEVYYAEDDETIGKSVKEYLEQQNCKVAVFDRIADVKKALIGHLPTIVLLDWNMPDGQGSELCLWIRERWKTLPIVYLTIRGDAHDIVTGFQNGADDYVVKPFDLAVLYSRILALLRRTKTVPDTKLFCDDLMLDKEKTAVYDGQKEIAVSQPEYRILLILMENKGKTITRNQLLEQVWDRSGNYVNDNGQFRVINLTAINLVVVFIQQGVVVTIFAGLHRKDSILSDLPCGFIAHNLRLRHIACAVALHNFCKLADMKHIVSDLRMILVNEGAGLHNHFIRVVNLHTAAIGDMKQILIMAVDKSDFLTIRVVLICHLRFPPFSNSILNFVLPSSDTSIKTVASKVLPVLSDLQFLSFTLPEPSNFCAVAEVMLLPMLAK